MNNPAQNDELTYKEAKIIHNFATDYNSENLITKLPEFKALVEKILEEEP